jgi:hypothetical protein
VAYLPGAAAWARVQLATQHDTSTDTGADPQEGQILAAGGFGFRERREIAVVLVDGEHARQNPAQRGGEIQTRPGRPRRPGNNSVTRHGGGKGQSRCINVPQAVRF